MNQWAIISKLALTAVTTTTIAAMLLAVACEPSSSSSGSSGVAPLDANASSTSSTSSGGSSGTSSGGSSGTSSGSSGGMDASTDASTDASMDASTDASSDADAGPPGITTSRSAANQLDLVGPGDQGTAPDGTADGTIEATIVGPVDGLILITTDANGNAAGGQQWDTVVLGDALPNIGTNFTVGSQTWCLGVYDGATKKNDADGRISLPAGVHNLTLAGSPSGFFNAGQTFRLYARNATSGVWSAGPNFTW